MAYKDRNKQRAFQRTWLVKNKKKSRLKAFEMLGGKCIDCGITDSRVLQFDHVVLVRRKFSGSNSYKTARAIINGESTADDINLLCANCHQIKTISDRKHFRYRRRDKLLYPNR